MDPWRFETRVLALSGRFLRLSFTLIPRVASIHCLLACLHSLSLSLFGYCHLVRYYSFVLPPPAFTLAFAFACILRRAGSWRSSFDAFGCICIDRLSACLLLALSRLASWCLQLFTFRRAVDLRAALRVALLFSNSESALWIAGYPIYRTT